MVVNPPADQVQVKLRQAAALYQKGQFAEAQAIVEELLSIQPDNTDALHLLGIIAAQTGDCAKVVELIGRATAIYPNDAAFYFNRGNALLDRQQLESAVACFDLAIALEPDCANAHHYRGNALLGLKWFAAAVASYEQALALKPEHEYLFGLLLHTKAHLCDWLNIDNELAVLLEKISVGHRVIPGFSVLALHSSLSIQRKAAEIWVNHKYPANPALGPLPKRPRAERIRIGYFSADYHNHVMAYLMAELFERHTRDQFEIIAFSFGPDKKGGMRKRLLGAFDRFIDVRHLPDREIAALSRELEIDIAVDLKGGAQDGRPGIFAYRAAPLQVSYIGYPGTMGAEYMDYLMADTVLIPAAFRHHYTEKIVYLPDSYQPNSRRRTIAKKTFTRQELGLPESGFVFCCFNNNYKITPSQFECWMRLLRAVEGSVLWLLEDNPWASVNLRQEAARRGVSPQRLVFAPRMELSEHLARYRAADLFLDTLPCNAHITASDALWVGLPVLTVTGEAFASRVAASLLHAVGLPELVTSTVDAYESLAIELASNPKKLRAIKTKLKKNRSTAPLFDTECYTWYLEDAYREMYRRYHVGLPTKHLYVPDSAADAVLP